MASISQQQRHNIRKARKRDANDKVVVPDTKTHGVLKVEKAKALDVKYNGALQLLDVLKAGPRLNAIFDAMDKNEINWDSLRGTDAEVKAEKKAYKLKFETEKLKEFFFQLRSLLRPGRAVSGGFTTRNIKFETSDLRRAQLEAVALKKSLEDVPAFDQSVKMKTTNNAYQLSPLTILHALGETTNSDRSLSVMAKDVPRTSTGTFQINKYWEYAFKNGMPESEYTKSFQGKMKPYVDNKLTLEWPDYQKWVPGKDPKGQRKKPNPSNYLHVHLAKDWNSNVDLVIASGHGNWLKELVHGEHQHFQGIHLGDAGMPTTHHRRIWGRRMTDAGRQLDFTEFILLKWEKKDHVHTNKPSELTIADFWRPAMTWYYLPKLMKVMNVNDPAAAHEGDFGDNFGSDFYEDGYDYDFGFYNGDYDDEELYDDQDYDFGYFDDGEYGYYEDYYYDQNDDDAYSLYEQAAVNLKKAQEEFRIAQRLKKWKGRRNYN